MQPTKRNNNNYTRVTEVLYPFSGLAKVDELILENAAARGTRVHTICEAIISGAGEWGVEPHLEGYIESFKKWWGDGFEVVEMERRFYCDELMITGQVDLIIKRDSRLVLCDLKTSYNPSKTWSVQGSAYVYLAQQAGMDISEIEFIKLSRYGHKARVFSYQADILFFKKCLEVYKYFFKTTEVLEHASNKTFTHINFEATESPPLPPAA